MKGSRRFSDAAKQGREKFIKGFNKTSDMVNEGVKNLSEGWGNFLRGLRENRNKAGAGSPPITMHGGKKNRRRRRKTRRKKRKTKRRTKRRRRTSKRRKRRR